MPDEHKGRFGPALNRPVLMRDSIMSRLSVLAALLLAVGLTGQASASARAEDKSQHHQAAAMPKISESQARSIAFSHGLVHVEEIALAGGRWEIAGRDPDGGERTLDLNAQDGSVIR
jgi:uncharacterized membrane protein YkoI